MLIGSVSGPLTSGEVRAESAECGIADIVSGLRPSRVYEYTL
jgi:hypothetical protein